MQYLFMYINWMKIMKNVMKGTAAIILSDDSQQIPTTCILRLATTYWDCASGMMSSTTT